jgi:hypothetical protein
MLVTSFSALAVFAFAASVVAEPRPYKPSLVKTSARELFAREVPAYRPSQEGCGEGDNCEQACGAGFVNCAANDDLIHCYNPSAAEICCPNKSGSSCDAGYYCTSDKDEETWCCPDAMNLKECAAAYGVVGGLVSQTAAPTSSVMAKPTGSPVKNGTYGGPKTAPSVPTGKPTGSWSPANLTATAGGGAAPTSTLITGAGNLVAPATGFALVMGAFAALL